jgi:sigma-E factor negative regulatory protein RseA
MSGKNDDVAAFEALSVLTDGEANEREVARACSAWRDSDEARARWQSYHLVGDVLRSDSLSLSGRSDADFLAGVRERLAQEPVVLAPAAAQGQRTAVAAQAALVQLGGIQAAAPAVLHHRRWAGPMSVAAGFVLVIGAVVSGLNGGSLAPSSTPAGSQGAVLAQGQGAQPVLVQALSGNDLPGVNGLQQGLSNGLSAEPALGQRVMAANPSFTENVREGSGNRVGYVVLMRDDQLDQLLAAQREHVDARSLTSPSGMVRSVSLSAADH